MPSYQTPEPDELPILWCGDVAQHPGHVWRHGRDEAWCYGANADGTSPYDPERAGYEPPPLAPPPSDSLTQLCDVAHDTQGHVTLHASYGPQASRFPEPDWSAQLVYIAGDPPLPVAWFGVGATIELAAASVIEQITDALATLEEGTP